MKDNSPLMEDLRDVARRHGMPALVGGMAELLEQLALAGSAAEMEKNRAEKVAAEACPRCRQARAVLQETLELLKPTPKKGGEDSSEGAAE